MYFSYNFCYNNIIIHSNLGKKGFLFIIEGSEGRKLEARNETETIKEY